MARLIDTPRGVVRIVPGYATLARVGTTPDGRPIYEAGDAEVERRLSARRFADSWFFILLSSASSSDDELPARAQSILAGAPAPLSEEEKRIIAVTLDSLYRSYERARGTNAEDIVGGQYLTEIARSAFALARMWPPPEGAMIDRLAEVDVDLANAVDRRDPTAAKIAFENAFPEIVKKQQERSAERPLGRVAVEFVLAPVRVVRSVVSYFVGSVGPVGWFMAAVFRYRKAIALLLAAELLSSFWLFFVPIAVGIVASSEDPLVVAIFVVAVFYVVASVCNALGGYYEDAVLSRVALLFRARLLGRTLRLPGRYSSGEMLVRASDGEAAFNTAIDIARSAVAALARLPFAFFLVVFYPISFLVSVVLVLFGLAVVYVLLSIAIYTFTSSISRLRGQSADAWVSVVANALPIKDMAATRRAYSKTVEILDAFRDATVRATFVFSFISIFANLVIAAGTAKVAYDAVQTARDAGVSFSAAVGAGIVFGFVLAPFVELLATLPEAQRLIVRGGRFLDAMTPWAHKPAPRNPPRPVERPHRIRFRNVEVLSPDGDVVARVNAQGSLRSPLAIVGPSGSGKTSLLRAIVGTAPYRGAIEIDGKDIREVSPMMRVVPDGDVIVPATIAENLRLVADIDPVEYRNLAKSVHLPERLWDPAERISHEDLSSGERRRFSFIRSLAAARLDAARSGYPPFFVCDEIEGPLDIDAKQAVRRLLASYPGPVIYITHSDPVDPDNVVVLSKPDSG